MQIDQCFFLGSIVRKHGFKGTVVVKLDTDQPESYRNLESVFVDNNGTLIPFFIEHSSLNGQFLRVKFEDVDTEEQADSLMKKGLFLPVAALPPLTGKKFYYHEVIGFEVIDAHHGKIGELKSINDTGAQALFEIQKDDVQILIPVIDDFIERIDRASKIMYVNAPEGLLDIYFE